MADPRCCPHCQGELPTQSPEGLCPGCLFQQALRDVDEAVPGEEPPRSPAPHFIPPTPEELARHFPQLEILRLIGQGGMGAVYQARQPKLDRLVAVKILPPEVARDSGFMQRFTREARSLARLNHPHIVTIYDFGETDGLFYFTMEYVDGKNARQLLEAGELTPALTLKIIPQVCDALQYAHDEGFVHRDIKPENLLLDRKGRVKIADFGLARLVGLTPTYLTLTGSHEVMGTLYYMAPEQMKRSHTVDHRADLFSLGVVFYELLTGELPVGRFAPPSHKVRVDARLDPVILRALAREPELRYQDAAELKREVESILASSAVPTPEAGPAADPPQLRTIGAWPSVRFTLRQIFRTGGEARGEIHRDAANLIVEFEEFWGFWKSGWKVVRIPFREITSIACQSESMPDIPGLAKWLPERKTQLVIKATQPSVLTGLPAGKPGRGRFLIPWGDRDVARQLVDSIVQESHPDVGGNAAASVKELVATGGGERDREQIRMELVIPGVGLLLTAVLTVVVNVVAVLIWWTEQRPHMAVAEGFALLIVLGTLVVASLLLTGAVQMMRLRSYPLAVAAAMLALLPWSFVWFIGLFLGIRALTVLRDPDVHLAFLKNQRSRNGGVPPLSPPKAAIPRPVVSFFRSVAGYMLPSALGRRFPTQAGKVPQPSEVAAPVAGPERPA